MPRTWAASRGENSFAVCTVVVAEASSRLEHYAFQRRPQLIDVGLNVQSLLCEFPLAAPLDTDLGILELVTGEDGDNVRTILDFTGADQLLNAGDRRRGCRLASNAVFGQCGLGIEYLFVGNRLA